MWLLFICVCMSAVFATSVAFMVIPTMTGIAAVMIGIKKKSVKYGVDLFLCCLPCLLLALCYFIMK